MWVLELNTENHPLKDDLSESHALSRGLSSLVARTTMVVFALGSWASAPLTNPQFPAWKVLLLFFIVLIPSLIGFANRTPVAVRRRGTYLRALLVSFAIAAPVLLHLKLYQLGGLVSWRSFVDGYPNARLATTGIGF
jgi:hypothetical protein